MAPGLLAALGVGLVARVVAGFLPSIVAEVSVAILLGAAVAAAAGRGFDRSIQGSVSRPNGSCESGSSSWAPA